MEDQRSHNYPINEIHRNVYVRSHEIFDIVYEKKRTIKLKSNKQTNHQRTHHNTTLDNNFYKISVNYEDLVRLDNIHMVK